MCIKANSSEFCVGIITWMHTFSPAKMWINGLKILNKPLLHLHTQFNRDIPWNSIDMNFMNLNQSTHGDREHGFIGARLRLPWKIIAGHWGSPDIQQRIEIWMRAAIGLFESGRLNVARFGDNMREVAVTEGDKVEAEIKFGWDVNSYGMGDFVALVNEVTVHEAQTLLEEYSQTYTLATDRLDSVLEQEKNEIALKRFMNSGNYEKNTGLVIVETFKSLDPSRMPAVLIHLHGPFIWGGDVLRSVENSYILENVALLAYKTACIRNMNGTNIDQMQEPLLRKHFDRKHGPNAYYGQTAGI